LNAMYIGQYRPVETSPDINTPSVLYPLNFCGDPANEPGCAWNRPAIYGIDSPDTTTCFRYPCS
jgi:hypothetical protein